VTLSNRSQDPEPLLPLQAATLHPPVALSIGGSDSGGGAGIQADLKTFAALHVHGCSAITCVTAQNTVGVERVDAMPSAAVAAQVEAVCRDLPVAALKTGMLLRRDLIEATADAIARRHLWRVIDPVMVSRVGAVLLEPEAIAALRDRLLPLADLVTPNVHEACLLSGLQISSPADLAPAAERIAALGGAAVLIKGGALTGYGGSDWLLDASGGRWLRCSPVDTPHSHGSGCTLAAAITAFLARGLALDAAVNRAKHYVQGGLLHALAIGSGQGPLCHWHGQLEL
jgi:hydroxymethylpyrimidine/phosphomethylpyrimidine kinase